MKFKDIKIGQKVWVYLVSEDTYKGTVSKIGDENTIFVNIDDGQCAINGVCKHVNPRQLSLRKIKPKKCAECEKHGKPFWIYSDTPIFDGTVDEQKMKYYGKAKFIKVCEVLKDE